MTNAWKNTADVFWIDLDSTTNIAVTPTTKYVGEQLVMKFTFNIPNNMYGSTLDHFVFEFPFEFELCYQKDSDIIGTIDGVQLETQIYADMRRLVNKIYFKIPDGITIAGHNPDDIPVVYSTLIISQIRAPCY